MSLFFFSALAFIFPSLVFTTFKFCFLWMSNSSAAVHGEAHPGRHSKRWFSNNGEMDRRCIQAGITSASWFGVFHNAWSYAHLCSRWFKTAQVLATTGYSQVQKSETVSLTKAQWKTGGKWQLPGVENNNCRVACAWAETNSWWN